MGFCVGHPLCEIVAFEDLLDGRVSRELDEIGGVELVHPFAS